MSFQCTRILQAFSIGDEKIGAALVLFARVLDVPQWPRMMQSFHLRDLRRFYGQLGVMFGFQPYNPTGHYELNMTLSHHQVCPRKP